MDWIQTVVIIFSIIGTLGTFMYWSVQRLENDIKDVSNGIEVAHRRMDKFHQILTQNINASNKRMDDLQSVLHQTISASNKRMDDLQLVLHQTISASNKRMDDLHQTLIDLVRERKI